MPVGKPSVCGLSATMLRGGRWSKTPFLTSGSFAQSGEPLKPFFFQFLFLAVQFRHPFGKRLVAGRFEGTAECVDFFARKFFAAGHDAILPRQTGLGRKKFARI